jgi:predicted ATPase
MNNIIISKISIKGFKSIRELKGFEPGRLNVMIGPNGAGKSSFIEFFRMLSQMHIAGGGLGLYTARAGGASDLLHHGAETTTHIEATISSKSGNAIIEYNFSLDFAKPDRLVYSGESFHSFPEGNEKNPGKIDLGAGHDETKVSLNSGNPAFPLFNALQNLRFYQFHNTSETSAFRLKWAIEDGWQLAANGGNLCAVLYRLYRFESDYYHRIVQYLRQAIPFFSEFVFVEEYEKIMLRWKETNSPKIFHAGLASDGMLRFMALVVLLAMPPEQLPPIIFIDEPELGLHPTANQLIAGLLQKAGQHAQLFISTQSVTLLNELLPEHIIVVDRPANESVYSRLNNQTLASWLEKYSLGELWENNILGGKP